MRTINYLINVYSITFSEVYTTGEFIAFCFLSALLTMYAAVYRSN